MELMHISIKEPLPTKLNKFKKTHPEAFFYWCKTEELLQNKE
jgi:hypothetical protein